MPPSNLEQPKPPKSRPQMMTLPMYLLIGLLLGFVGQEIRWRSSSVAPTSSLGQAEKDFQASDFKTAAPLFERLADQNDPVAQYWVAHMTELGLGVPRNPSKAIEL